MPSNIRYFPDSRLNQPGPASLAWGPRLVMAMMYLAIGFLFRNPIAADLNLLLLMLLAYACFARGYNHRLIFVAMAVLLFFTLGPVINLFRESPEALVASGAIFEVAAYGILFIAIGFWTQLLKGNAAAAYFLRYHFLQAGMTFLALALTFILGESVLGVIVAFFNMIGLGAALASVLSIPGLVQLTVWAIVGILTFILTLGALKGDTPRIPFISDLFRRWI